MQSEDGIDELTKLKLNTRQKKPGRTLQGEKKMSISSIRKGKKTSSVWQSESKAIRKCRYLPISKVQLKSEKELLADNCFSLLYKGLVTSQEALPPFLNAKHHSPLQIKHDSL